MPLPEKDYFTLPSLARRWKIPIADVRHYSETGKLLCSVWIHETWIEMGTFKKQANGKKLFIPDSKVYVEGLVGITPEDCRLIFRNKEVCSTYFMSLKRPGWYLQIADEGSPDVCVKAKDIVVRHEDRNQFEQKHKLAISKATQIIHSFGEFRYSDNYETINLRGHSFRLGQIQARIIAQLLEAARTKNPWVHGKILLYEAGSQSERIKNIFQSKTNWRELIESDGRGYYRLNL